MSKLYNIILKSTNKVLEGKQLKLGDYIDPTKAEIKALIRELIGEDEHGYEDSWGHHKDRESAEQSVRNRLKTELRKKVQEL